MLYTTLRQQIPFLEITGFIHNLFAVQALRFAASAQEVVLTMVLGGCDAEMMRQCSALDARYLIDVFVSRSSVS
ncbi:MAG: hypothetical protein JO296_20360 [Pseudonocardiales bacterium]|nr:hypothetical protein [Pseudonocardiales bacterium]MBV9652469.1 hypothetical protein [Pseudonocardiales bacterium]